MFTQLSDGFQQGKMRSRPAVFTNNASGPETPAVGVDDKASTDISVNWYIKSYQSMVILPIDVYMPGIPLAGIKKKKKLLKSGRVTLREAG